MTVLNQWRRLLYPVGNAQLKPARWVLPGFAPPGLTLVCGAPKTFKSTLALCAAGQVVSGKGMPASMPSKYRAMLPQVQRGTVIYVPYEQSASTLRRMYEQRVVRAVLKKDDYSFSVVRDAWEWQVDEPIDSQKDIGELMEDLKPALLIIDPWVMAHSLEENDPRVVKPLAPLRQIALKNGTALVLVHHANKKSDASGASAPGDFNRVRGTTALWGMADAGHLLTKTKSGDLVTIVSEFKDFPGATWMWKPPK